SVQHEPSANNPCTSTTLRAFGGAVVAAMPRLEISDAAAPASKAVENVRLSIMVLPFALLQFEKRRRLITPCHRIVLARSPRRRGEENLVSAARYFPSSALTGSQSGPGGSLAYFCADLSRKPDAGSKPATRPRFCAAAAKSRLRHCASPSA